MLERYQRYLFLYRKKNGEPMSFRSQHSRLVPLRMWFRWMTRQNHLLHNPASELELPRLGHTAAQEHLLRPGGRANPPALRHRRSHRPARPGHDRGAVLDRHPPHGDRRAQALRPLARPGRVAGPPGQGQERPLCAHRRAGHRMACRSTSARRGLSLPSSRTT